MQNTYDPITVEKIAQQHWININAYTAVEHRKDKNGLIKKKFYTCSMLPYPSGKLHMGHVRNYTINDVMYRYLRMNNYNVLMPMGWDAFGMPAENAAVENGMSPAQWTYKNIAYMKKQMQTIGFAIDWSREIITCTPEYYKWNQWMFLKMLNKGIIYKKNSTVNWDPIEQTVLANEQVINGRGWRSGAQVIKKNIPMYYARITQYAEELLDDIKTTLHGWPERVRLMQINWISKLIGVRFAFLHSIVDNNKLIQNGKLWVFTTRIDTIMGVTFCVVSTEHALANFASKLNPELTKFINKCKQGSVAESNIATTENLGMSTGLYVIHPLTRKKVAVWVVNNFINLNNSNEDAAMGVPAHNKCDFMFAQKYNLPIKQVIEIPGKNFSATLWDDWYSQQESTKIIFSGKYNNLTSQIAADQITSDLIKDGLGEKSIAFRLHDWGISRQRYWGTPIPIICCIDCGDVPVPEQDLPVLLPESCTSNLSSNPLKYHEEFLHVHCPHCGKLACRETDTMDTFVDSSWYYMRYTSANNTQNMLDARNQYWMPIDQYIGGIEHAILHLLYARFWTKVMRDLSLIKFSEPFTNLLTQGMVLSKVYYRINNITGQKKWFHPNDVSFVFDNTKNVLLAISKQDGLPVEIGNVEKMSKSKNNGIDPQTQIKQFGADSVRLFVIFASPPEQNLEWSNTGVEGAYRFLRRIWTFSYKNVSRIKNACTIDMILLNNVLKDLRYKIYKILQQINHDFKKIKYNTVVSSSMKMFNTLESTILENQTNNNAVLAESMSILLRILNPVTPHITHILWHELGFSIKMGDILDAEWPTIDIKALERTKIKILIQINGKLRSSIIVPKNTTLIEIEKTVLTNQQVKKFLSTQPKKIIFIPNKLINIVV